VALVRRLVAKAAPPEVMTTTDWARQRRRLSAKATARPGTYNPDLTPWVKHMHAALDDPAVFKVVCKKSAQVAWTDGVLLNYIGRRIDIEPCPMIIMFAKEGAAKEFNDEKLMPMLEVTPALADKVPVDSKRSRDNRWQYKGFPGGFLKLVSSNSASSVKSTPAPVVCVEEPDDANENVAQQGDTITLLEERTKTYARRKIVFGGTPTIKGLSRIDAAYQASNRVSFWVPCPHCGEHQVLAWEHVTWEDDPLSWHEVFGHARPETARYRCPHCASRWTEAEKNRAVRLLEPRAEAEFRGVVGFYINELYSPFPGSQLPRLVEKHLAAQHALAKGDDTKARAFDNNTLGIAYEYKTDIPEPDDLKLRAETYAERSVPSGGLLLTAGVDVQHDRLAVVIRAWGRAEESWLVYWGELPGSTLVAGQGAWADLDMLLTADFVHVTGATLRVEAASIDGSDGNRTEIVNTYVRARRSKGLRYMTVKGASEQGDDKREIFSTPRRPDLNQRNKPSKRSIEVHIVGTTRAKDLILETRVKHKGKGPGAMHWYAGVRPDYWEQLTSEVKAPSKANRAKKTWQKKGGVRNEALDCEVYALHAARSLKTNLMHDAHWTALEQRLRQRPLLAEPAPPPEQEQEDHDDEAPPPLPTTPVAAAPAEPATPAVAPEPATPQAKAVAAPPAKPKRRKSLHQQLRGNGFSSSSW
jgi:phage terminase large subunit GpA-like protein